MQSSTQASPGPTPLLRNPYGTSTPNDDDSAAGKGHAPSITPAQFERLHALLTRRPELRWIGNVPFVCSAVTWNA